MGATFKGDDKTIQQDEANLPDSSHSDATFASHDIVEKLYRVLAEKNKKELQFEKTLRENERIMKGHQAQIQQFVTDGCRSEAAKAEAEANLLKLRIDAKRIVGNLQAEVKKLADELHLYKTTGHESLEQAQADLAREKEHHSQISIHLKKYQDVEFNLNQEVIAATDRVTALQFALRKGEEHCAALRLKMRAEKETATKLVEEYRSALGQARTQLVEVAAQRDEWCARFASLSEKTKAQADRERNFSSHVSEIERNAKTQILRLEKECKNLTVELERIRSEAEIDKKRIADEFTNILLSSKKEEETAQQRVKELDSAYKELQESRKLAPSADEHQKLKLELEQAISRQTESMINARVRAETLDYELTQAYEKIEQLKESNARILAAAEEKARLAATDGDEYQKLRLEREQIISHQTESMISARVRAETLDYELTQAYEKIEQLKESNALVLAAVEEERARAKVTEDRLKAEIQQLQSKHYLLNLEIAALARTKGEPVLMAVPNYPPPSPTADLEALIREKNHEIETVRRRLGPKPTVS